MGALDRDLALSPAGDGRYGVSVSEDWTMWGPLGGFVAALALVAVGRETSFARPISLSCSFAKRATFDVADVVVKAQRVGSSASAYSATVVQGGDVILESTCWAANRGEGPEHIDIAAPDVVPPAAATPAAGELDWLPFVKNLDVAFLPSEDPPAARPRWRGWTAFRPVATFTDPWLDAARSVILLDISGFSAAAMYHGTDAPYTAPSLDLHVSFHHAVADAPWLLMDAHAPVSIDGVLAWQGNLWTEDGRLAAMGHGQNIWRRAE